LCGILHLTPSVATLIFKAKSFAILCWLCGILHLTPALQHLFLRPRLLQYLCCLCGMLRVAHSVATGVFKVTSALKTKFLHLPTIPQ
jgi:hypothetical protein